MNINIKSMNYIEPLTDGKWKEIYITYDENGIKHKKTIIKQLKKNIIKTDGNKEYFDKYTFRELTPNGYVYITPKERNILERKKWKPFCEIHLEPDQSNKDIYIEFTNSNLNSQKTFNEIKENLETGLQEEYLPPTNINFCSNNDSYQLPSHLINAKYTVVVSNIICSLDDEQLYEIIKEMAEENGIPSKISIPPIKFVYDRQTRTEKPLPRLAFIEYPHEADAHYSIEYLDKKVIEYNYIEATLQTKKLK